MRINNLPTPNFSSYRLIADSFTKSENNMQILNNSNYTLNTFNVISTNLNNKVSSQWTTSGTNILCTLGNVGIGGIDPLYKFTVAVLQL